MYHKLNADAARVLAPDSLSTSVRPLQGPAREAIDAVAVAGLTESAVGHIPDVAGRNPSATGIEAGRTKFPVMPRPA